MQPFTLRSSDGRTPLHAVLWKPQGDPLAILQLSHGMVEYIERYDAFAQFLSAKGFLVVGHDHIGHGASIKNAADWGHFSDHNGFETVIEDLHVVRKHMQIEYPNLPYFLLGHSMGSFAVRNYITRHAQGLCGALILGTGNQDVLTLHAAHAMATLLSKTLGPRHRSKLLTYLALGSLNKPFRSEGENAFLTRDQQIVAAYNAEPRCSFQFTAASYQSMFSGMLALHNRDVLSHMPRELPLFLASGSADPLGGMGKGIEKLLAAYKSLGMKDVTLKLYPDARHELLNELDRESIYADIFSWLSTHFPA